MLIGADVPDFKLVRAALGEVKYGGYRIRLERDGGRVLGKCNTVKRSTSSGLTDIFCVLTWMERFTLKVPQQAKGAFP